MLDGLLVGDPASHGFVDGSDFLHADLDIENTADSVAASPTDDPPGGEAFAVLSLAGRGSAPEVTARAMLAKSSLEHGQVTAGKIGALPAARVEGRDHSGRIAYRFSAHWIAHRNLVFQVTVAAPTARWARYQGSLARVAGAFS